MTGFTFHLGGTRREGELVLYPAGQALRGRTPIRAKSVGIANARSARITSNEPDTQSRRDAESGGFRNRKRSKPRCGSDDRATAREKRAADNLDQQQRSAPTARPHESPFVRMAWTSRWQFFPLGDRTSGNGCEICFGVIGRTQWVSEQERRLPAPPLIRSARSNPAQPRERCGNGGTAPGSVWSTCPAFPVARMTLEPDSVPGKSAGMVRCLVTFTSRTYGSKFRLRACRAARIAVRRTNRRRNRAA